MLAPELLVLLQPVCSRCHGRVLQSATHDASGLLSGDEIGPLERVEMLDDGRKRHDESGRDLGDREIRGGGQPFHDRAPGRIGESSERPVEVIV